jgi:hypothetical protein
MNSDTRQLIAVAVVCFVLATLGAGAFAWHMQQHLRKPDCTVIVVGESASTWHGTLPITNGGAIDSEGRPYDAVEAARLDAQFDDYVPTDEDRAFAARVMAEAARAPSDE